MIQKKFSILFLLICLTVPGSVKCQFNPIDFIPIPEEVRCYLAIITSDPLRTFELLFINATIKWGYLNPTLQKNDQTRCCCFWDRIQTLIDLAHQHCHAGVARAIEEAWHERSNTLDGYRIPGIRFDERILACDTRPVQCLGYKLGSDECQSSPADTLLNPIDLIPEEIRCYSRIISREPNSMVNLFFNVWNKWGYLNPWLSKTDQIRCCCFWDRVQIIIDAAHRQCDPTVARSIANRWTERSNSTPTGYHIRPFQLELELLMVSCDFAQPTCTNYRLGSDVCQTPPLEANLFHLIEEWQCYAYLLMTSPFSLVRHQWYDVQVKWGYFSPFVRIDDRVQCCCFWDRVQTIIDFTHNTCQTSTAARIRNKWLARSHQPGGYRITNFYSSDTLLVRACDRDRPLCENYTLGSEECQSRPPWAWLTWLLFIVTGAFLFAALFCLGCLLFSFVCYWFSRSRPNEEVIQIINAERGSEELSGGGKMNAPKSVEAKKVNADRDDKLEIVKPEMKESKLGELATKSKVKDTKDAKINEAKVQEAKVQTEELKMKEDEKMKKLKVKEGVEKAKVKMSKTKVADN